MYYLNVLNWSFVGPSGRGPIRLLNILPRAQNVLEVVARYADEVGHEVVDGEMLGQMRVDERFYLGLAHLVHVPVQVEQIRQAIG